MMELTWIDDFLALGQTRNFTRAADMRCTTQPAFSRRIRRLEDWVGAPLFNRDVTPVTLTAAGEEFQKRAPRLREDILDARRATLSVTSHFAATKRIYTTNTIATCFLPAWLTQQNLTGQNSSKEKAAREKYSLTVASITGCYEAVRQRRAHMALVPRFEDGEDISDLHPAVAARDTLSLVAETGTRSRITLKDGVLSGPLMVYAPGTAYGAHITRLLQRHNIRIADEPLCESASAEALLAQVKADTGAAWLPRLLAGPALKRCAVPESLDIPYEIVLIRAG
jgi:DNA-binding transcriptional LysR family regulator